MTVRSGKYIGIDQWVPFAVLDAGMSGFLEKGFVDKDEIRKHLREFTQGENRASKAARVAVNILSRPEEILNICKKELTNAAYLRLLESERKALLTSLLACTYPIFYDLLIAMAIAFKVQPQINKQFINQKMSKLYGSNRSFDIALDSLIIMIVELDIVKRVKRSLYSQSEIKTLHTPCICEAYIYADIKMSGSKTVLLEDIDTRPWFIYNKVEYKAQKHTHLLKFSEGRIGGGYIGIRA